ncbi:hypothetical protein PR048_022322 [Dryococelus australis]|uniref:Uncharacterized protein n=1 Tax=Dryococelus australis TaxID=614101 RepID=A0ABQ9H0P7_9NEOP|nr:hypothetical protein PR048_022322 [Dryococelus australis]
MRFNTRLSNSLEFRALMLKRLLDNKSALSRHLPELNIDDLMVSEWNVIDCYVEILQPLYDATVQICGERTPSASMVIIIIFSITLCLNTCNEVHGKEGPRGAFAVHLFMALKTKFFSYERIILVDPRLKTVIVTPEGRTLGGKKMLERKVEQMKPSDSKPEPGTPLVCKMTTKSTSLWNAFDVLANSAIASTTVSEPEHYLNMATIPRNNDPLKLWGKKRLQYIS